MDNENSNSVPEWMSRAWEYEASADGQRLAGADPDTLTPREWLTDYLLRLGYSEESLRESLTSADYATRRAGNAPDARWREDFQKYRRAWVVAHGEDGFRVPATMGRCA